MTGKKRGESRRFPRGVLIAGAVVCLLAGAYLVYRNTDLYAYRGAEALYRSGDRAGAVSAFLRLGDYRDSRTRAREARFEREGEIIVDHVTSLRWLVGPDRDTRWDQADHWVKSLGSPWRMPCREELRGLYDAGIGYGRWAPFGNGGRWVWSGELHDSLTAWLFFFGPDAELWDTLDREEDGRAFAVQ